MKKIFLFDINHVFIDGHDYRKIYDAMKCSCTYERFLDIARFSKLFYDCEYGTISTDEFLSTLNELVGSTISKEDYIRAHNEAKGKIFDGTLRVVEDIKKRGHAVGILSNLKKIDVQYFQKLVDTDGFDYEFYSCYIHAMKPSDRMYRYVSEITDTKENEVYLFDDLEENCEKAREYGIKAICTTGENIEENYRKYVLGGEEL